MQRSVSLPVCLPACLPSFLLVQAVVAAASVVAACGSLHHPSIPTNQSVRLKLPEEAEPSMRGIVAATDGRQQPTDRRASNNERNEAMDYTLGMGGMNTFRGGKEGRGKGTIRKWLSSQSPHMLVN